MRRVLPFFLCFCLVALLLPALTFGNPFLVCDPNPGAIGIILEVNGIEMPEFATEADGSLKQDLAGYEVGDFIVRAQANFGLWGWSGYSVPFSFTKPNLQAPFGLRVFLEPSN